ncbi:TRAP transporter substrate-binding protein [Rhodovastum atsumiense]|uniref:TRAP transporter substrate-binding protein n=2 Tax=Rhodovastum atsumiense TaxID=504468 RepID=A0A5M6IQ22_9PROT|nr:TRAP transporter substrate-binding protein [Rhodovastum atsumiense]
MRRAHAARTLRLGHIFAADSHLAAGATAFAEEVARRTGGRIQIQQFPNAVLGGDVELVKAVQLGTVDFAFITGVGLPSIVPETDVVHIPFLFRNLAHAHAVLDGELGVEFGRLLAAKGVTALAWGENGLRHVTNSRLPIATPGDFKGLRIRVPQSEVMRIGFEAFGATASQLAFPLLFDALKTGKFDGEENPIAVIRASRFDQVQRFLSLTGHVYDPAVLAASPDTLEELSPEDRTILAEAARTGARVSREAAGAADASGVAALRQAGMQVVDGIDRAAFGRALAAVMPEFEKRFGRDRIERIRRVA